MAELLEELSSSLSAWKEAGTKYPRRGEKDFRLPDADWRDAMLACLHTLAKLQALGRPELDEELAQAKGVMSELFAAYRVSPLRDEDCIVRKKDGDFCRATIGKQLGSAGDVSSNLQACGRHADQHALWVYADHVEMTSCGEHPRPEELLEVVLRNGKCRICLEQMGSRELKESCRLCHLTVHQACLVDQLEDADWAPVKDREKVEFFCCGCATERFGEVCLAKELLQGTGSEFAIFEPLEDAFADDKSEGYWTRYGRHAAKEWACTRAVVRKSPSPWARGPRPLEAETPLAEERLRIVVGAAGERSVEKPHGPAVDQALAMPRPMCLARPPVAAGTGGGEASSVQRAPESEGAMLRRLDEMQLLLTRMELQGPGTANKSSLAYYHESARLGTSSCANLVTGKVDGFAKDEEGAANTLGFYLDFDYIGMRAKGDPQKRRAKRWTGGGERVDRVVRHQDCAEAKGVSEVLMLGGVELKASQSRRSTPEQAIVVQYWMKVKAELTVILESKLSVYDPEHVEYRRFQYLGAVAWGRVSFLEATTTFMVQELMHHKWPTIWRYLCVFAAYHFYDVSIEDFAPLDLQIVKVLDSGGGGGMRALARDRVNPLYLEEARSMQAAAAEVEMSGGSPSVRKTPKPGPVEGRGGGKAATRDKGGRSCPLCGDPNHLYRLGEYDHPADREITVQCPRILSDGAKCGLKHAFSGPLAVGTNCRGNLEPQDARFNR